MIPLPPDIRAWFEARYEPEPNTGCWLWTNALCQGYGKVNWRHGGRYFSLMAHRLSWFLRHGTLPPDGLVLDHMCRVRSCVNPDHVRAVTPTVNALENSLGRAAANRAKPCCPKCGGPFSRLKPISRPRERECLPCRRSQVREYYHRRRRRARLTGEKP